MPRFVVLYHECPPGYHRPSHWDLMLEMAGVLRTWALATIPDRTVQEHAAINAEALHDHRLAYLEYAGPVSGGRGTVTRYDQGEYELLQSEECELIFQLAGEKLTGRWKLTRTTSMPAGHWDFLRI